MKNIFKSMALTEVYNYSFVSDNTKEIFAIQNVPELLNPVSSTYHFMRPSLIPNLLVCTQNNTRFYGSFGLFECGDVFAHRGEEIGEREQVAVILVRPQSFLEMKGIVESFLHQLGISEFEFDETVEDTYEGKIWYHPARVATIKSSGEIIGIMGNTNPLILRRLGFAQGTEVAQCSFNMGKLFDVMETNIEYEPIPKFPSVVRDISILVDKDVSISKLLNTINQAEKSSLIKDVDVFDIFESAADEKKSVAFHVTYRADDRTLTEKEVNEIQKVVTSALERDVDAEVR